MPSVVNWSELAVEAIWGQDIVVQCKLHVKSGNARDSTAAYSLSFADSTQVNLHSNS